MCPTVLLKKTGGIHKIAILKKEFGNQVLIFD